MKIYKQRTENMSSGIIMIDDNEDDYEIILRGFKSVDLNESLTWFRSAKEALDYLQKVSKGVNGAEAPKMIILDLNMPGLDGRNMLNVIKADKKLKSIPTIILSTSKDEQDIRYCYENGANTYFQKPLRYQQLQEICSSIKSYWSNASVL